MGLVGFRKLLSVVGILLFLGIVPVPALMISGDLGETERFELGVVGAGVSGLAPLILFSKTKTGGEAGEGSGEENETSWQLLSVLGAVLWLCMFPAMTVIDLAQGSGPLILSATGVGVVGFFMMLVGEVSLRRSASTGEGEAQTGWRKFRGLLDTIGSGLFPGALSAVILGFYFEGGEWFAISMVAVAVLAFLISGRRGSGDAEDDGDGGE
ncbi:hypothetical protein [Thermobifida fusca]|uniref:hypothetical protein n=1 Tax=Thermobifida fusca TaxID=2021 RepID=UPI00156BBC58|nr:hypothetical protein [Thermobifida fusca]